MGFSTQKFITDENGSVSVEAIFAVPILVLAIALTLDVWDAFTTITVSQKATYTVADMLSRESQVGDDFLQTLYDLYDFLAHSSDDNAIRISVVSQCIDPSASQSVKALEWSEGLGGITGHADIGPLEDRVPPMHDGEWLIIVESEQDWQPTFDIGIGSHTFRETSITRPRFSGTLRHDDYLFPVCA